MKIKLFKLAILLLAAAGFAVSSCTDYSADIKEIKSDVTSLQTDVASLKSGDVASLKNQVAALETAKTALENRVTSVEKSVEYLNTTVADLKTKDQALDSKIDGVNSALEAYKSVVDGKFEAASTAAQQALDKAVSEIQTSMQEINTKVNGVEAGYKAADAALSSEISGINSAYKTADAAIQKSLEALKIQVEANTASIQTLTGTAKTLTESVANIDAAYKAADAAIDAAYKAADQKNYYELQSQVVSVKNEVTTKLSEVKTELAANIATVQANLEKAQKAFADSLTSHAAAAQKSYDDVKKYIDAQISIVTEAYKKADAEVTANYEAADAQLKKDYTDADATNKAALEKQIKDLETQYLADIKALKEDYDKQIATLNTRLSAAEADIVANKAAAAKDLLNEVTILNTKLAALVSDYQKADAELKSELQKADQALAADIKANASAISENFKTIVANKAELEASIAKVVAERDSADARLARVIAANKDLAEQALAKAVSDLNTQLKALESDYIAADNAIIKAYTDADAAVTAAFQAADSDLEAAYQAADLVLFGTISGVAEALNELATTFTQQLADVKAELAQKIADTNAALADYKVQIAGEIARLDGRIDALKTSLDETNETIVKLNQRMEDSDKAIVDDLSSFKTLTNKNIEDLAAAIELLTTWQTLAIGQIADNSADIDANAKAIGINAQAIEDIKAALDDYVLKTVFEEQVETLEASIATKLDIATYEAEQEVLNAKVDDINAAYQEADKAIEKAYKEADEAIKKQIEALNETVKTLATKASVKELADALADLTAKYAEEIPAIENLLVEHDNMILDNQDAISALQDFTQALEKAIADNSAAIGENSTAIKALQDALALLTTKVDGNAEKIADLYGLLAALELRVEDNEVDITSLTSELSGVAKRVADNEDAITILQKAVADNAENIKKLFTSVATNAAKITALDTRVSALEVNYKALKVTVDSLIAEVDAHVAALQDQITANEGAISALFGNLTELTTQFTNFKEATLKSIEDLEAADSGLNIRLTAAENDIQAIVDSLNKYVYDKTAGVLVRLKIAEDNIVEINSTLVKLDTTIAGVKRDLLAKIEAVRLDLQAQITSAVSRITTLEGSVQTLQGDVEKLKKETSELLDRIQSLVYVPMYNDGKADINFILEGDGTADGTTIYPAKTSFLFKVYPADAAKALTVDNVTFDVLPVKTRASEGTPTEASFKVIDVKAAPVIEGKVYDGFVLVTVMPQDMENMLVLPSELPEFIGNIARNQDPDSPVERPSFDKKILGQSYSFCLKVTDPGIKAGAEGTGNVRTSEYVNALPAPVKVWLDPAFFYVENKGELTEVVGDFVDSTKLRIKKLPYTNTQTVDMNGGLTPAFTFINSKGDTAHVTPEFLKNNLNVEIPVFMAYSRSYYSPRKDSSKPEVTRSGYNYRYDIDSLNTVGIVDRGLDSPMSSPVHKGFPGFLQTTEQWVDWDAPYDMFQYCADAPVNVYDPSVQVNGGLNPEKDATARREAIYYMEVITLIAATNHQDIGIGQGAHAFSIFEVTKEQQTVPVEPITINWDFNQDAYYDGWFFQNMFKDTTAWNYSRTGIKATPNVDSVKVLASKGCTLADFKHKTCRDSSITSEPKAKYTPKISCIIDGENLSFNMTELQYGFKYGVKASFEFDFIDVDIVGDITTIDRNRQPVEITVPASSRDYAKNCIVDADKDSEGSWKSFTAMYEGIKALGYLPEKYGEIELNAKSFAKLVGEKKVFTDGTNNPVEGQTFDRAQLWFRADSCWFNYMQDYKLGMENTYNCYTKFYTWYGQPVIFKMDYKWNQPAYDFLHNEHFVYGKDKAYYSQVNPLWSDSKEILTQFNVQDVNLNQAFDIVSTKDPQNPVTVAKVKDQKSVLQDTTNTGLRGEFFFRTAPESTGITMGNVETPVENFNMYKISYLGWDENVPVLGKLYIISNKEDIGYYKAEFPTTQFSEGGDYFTYNVVKYDPLVSFESTKEVSYDVESAKTYTVNPYASLKLLDIRGKDCIANGTWVVGNNTAANGFATGVTSKKAYQIQDTVSYAISSVPEKIKHCFSLVKNETTGVMELVFDYEQEVELTDDVNVVITVGVTNIWKEKPMTADVKVKFHPIHKN